MKNTFIVPARQFSSKNAFRPTNINLELSRNLYVIAFSTITKTLNRNKSIEAPTKGPPKQFVFIIYIGIELEKVNLLNIFY